MENDDIRKDEPLSKVAKERPRATEETSFGKDLFIVAGGIVFVLLVFFLYRSLAGLDLDMKFPQFSNAVIGAQGNPLDNSDKKIDPQLVQGFFRIGFICAAIGILAFLFFWVLLNWPKYIKHKPLEREEEKSDSEGSADSP